MKIRLVGYLLVSVACIGLIVRMFWLAQIQYAQPTIVPENHLPIVPGSVLPEALTHSTGESKGVLLHFFNPDCPCSRFNVTEFRELVEYFGKEIDFKVVLESDEWDSVRFARKYHINVTVIADPDGQLADACGVYSTPQAVIASSSGEVYYSGNYNRARFCNQPETRFAYSALTHFTAGEELPAFDEVALTAYGCNLPSDEQYIVKQGAVPGLFWETEK